MRLALGYGLAVVAGDLLEQTCFVSHVSDCCRCPGSAVEPTVSAWLMIDGEDVFPVVRCGTSACETWGRRHGLLIAITIWRLRLARMMKWYPPQHRLSVPMRCLVPQPNLGNRADVSSPGRLHPKLAPPARSRLPVTTELRSRGATVALVSWLRKLAQL